MRTPVAAMLTLSACVTAYSQKVPETSQRIATASKAAFSPSGTCVFESKEALYEGSPKEPIKLVWRKSEGAIESWDWLHGGVPWFSFAADKGSAKLVDSYYYLLNVGITTKHYETTRYSLKGYIAENKSWPNATFAVIYEGTGTAWFVAHGTLNCS